MLITNQTTFPRYPFICSLCHIEQHSQTMSYAVEMEAQSKIHCVYLYNSAVISMTEAPIACGYKFRKAA